MKKLEYSLPFKPGHKIRKHAAPSHKKMGYPYAIDWAMPIGTPILAIGNGIVRKTESRFNSYGVLNLKVKQIA